ADLIANHADQGIDAIGLLRALGNAPLRGETFRAIAPGGDDGACSDEEPWSGNDSLFDRLLDAHVRVTGALGPQVAQGGKPGLERVAAMIGRPADAKRQWLLQDLVVPGSLVVRMEKKV